MYKDLWIEHDQECGAFSNNIIIDPAGLRSAYASYGLGSGLNSSAGVSLSYGSRNGDGDDNDEGDGSGGGNFTNRRRSDPRYLEDVLTSKCNSPNLLGGKWEDICLDQSCSEKMSGNTCDTLCSINPPKGYRRTYGEAKIIYNDRVNNPIGKVNRLKKNAIHVPWSESYNNITPANPYIR